MFIIINTILALLTSMTLITLFIDEYRKYLRTDYSLVTEKPIEMYSFVINYKVPKVTENNYNFESTLVIA